MRIELKQNDAKTYDMYPDDLLFWKHDGKELMLLVEHEGDSVPSPREDDSPVCRMYCHHPRHHLGDYPYKKQPEDWWRMLIEHSVPKDEIARRLTAGLVKGYGPNDPYDGGPMHGNIPETADELVERFLDAVADDDIPVSLRQAMIRDYAVVMPLWLYDHSGITMSCGARTYPYNDRFDSGQVGWIAAVKHDILREFGGGQDEDAFDWQAKAKAVIASEVDTYDKWLTGDVYRYVLYERDIENTPDDGDYSEDDWTEIDACGWFYGTDILSNGISDHIGQGLSEAIAAGTYETGTHATQTQVIHGFRKDC